MNNFDNIPPELRPYNQWVVWKEEMRDGKLTKPLYDAKTGQHASVDNSITWTNFNSAVDVANNGMGFSGIGFVLTEHDPFCLIDLDKATDAKIITNQNKIYEAFAGTYTEYSPSGTGCHIICKGSVPHGRKRSSVEIYSSLRYMTMTGNVIANNPIIDKSELVKTIWDSMGKDTKGNVVLEGPQTEDDKMVLAKAMSMTHSGDKFKDLYAGNWQQHYPDIAAAGQGPSEADFALIDMIQKQTKNREQIIRMFLASGLGQRSKAKRKDYVNTMVSKSFDQDAPPQDFELFEITAGNVIAAAKANGKANGHWSSDKATPAQGADFLSGVPVGHGVSEGTAKPTNDAIPQDQSGVNPYTFPPGLVGQIATYIYQTSPRPVTEISLLAALGLMAGITARSFQTPTGLALNLYLLLLADTGRGKDAMKQGIYRIINAAKEITPAIGQFVGPSEFRSDAGLNRELEARHCFVSIFGEYGIRMQEMTAPNAPPHSRFMKRSQLELFHAGDRTAELSEMAYSDRTRNTAKVYRPCFSILGESTRTTYYEALNEDQINQGLVSRILPIEYPGIRTDLNTYNENPPADLVVSVANLGMMCFKAMEKNTFKTVVFDPAADQAQKLYDKKVDRLINTAANDALCEIWNRAHVKTLRLAALVAVGINPHVPNVTLDVWQWAERLVEHSTLNIVGKFERGEVGRLTGNDAQNRAMADIMIDWVTGSWDDVKKSCQLKEGELYHKYRLIIPRSYISNRAAKAGAFINDRDANRAIYATLRNFETEGLVTKMRANQVKDANNALMFSSHGEVYIITDETMFRERAQGRKRSL